MGFLKRMLAGAVAPPEGAEDVYSLARRLAADPQQRRVIVVRHDGSLLGLGCPPDGSVPPQNVAYIESILPSTTLRNVAVIAETEIGGAASRAEAGSVVWSEAGRRIPFFGILNGLAYVGHAVWIFDGDPAAIADACRDADVLVVDGAFASRLTSKAVAEARGVMRGGTILIHDREGYRLRPFEGPDGGESDPWNELFGLVRAHTSQNGTPRIVLVRPDLNLFCLPCIPLESMAPEQLAQAQRVIPAGVPRKVAVIAPTALIEDPADQEADAVTHLRAAGRTIPFFGLLMNLASVGNPVWIFDGRRESLDAGCAGADLLLIDSAKASEITTGDIARAAKSMHSVNIVVFDRETRQMKFLWRVGPTEEKLEFND